MIRFLKRIESNPDQTLEIIRNSEPNKISYWEQPLGKTINLYVVSEYHEGSNDIDHSSGILYTSKRIDWDKDIDKWRELLRLSQEKG